MQGFRYCVANAELAVVSVHHTHQGASSFVHRNPGVNLQIWNNGQPYAVAVGDIVPARAVRIEPLGKPPSTRWKRLIGK